MEVNEDKITVLVFRNVGHLGIFDFKIDVYMYRFYSFI